MAGESKYSVLIISSGEKFTAALKGVLPEYTYYPVVVLTSVAAARREILEREYDLIIVNAPVPDEFGVNFLLDASENTSSGLLLFVPGDVYDEISAKTEDLGILTISKPVTAAIVKQSLGLLCATRAKLHKLEAKTQSFEEKIEEIKIINRAKWMLIDNMQIDEPAAHRYIEKMAMDMRKSKREIAEKLIRELSGSAG